MVILPSNLRVAEVSTQKNLHFALLHPFEKFESGIKSLQKKKNLHSSLQHHIVNFFMSAEIFPLTLFCRVIESASCWFNIPLRSFLNVIAAIPRFKNRLKSQKKIVAQQSYQQQFQR